MLRIVFFVRALGFLYNRPPTVKRSNFFARTSGEFEEAFQFRFHFHATKPHQPNKNRQKNKQTKVRVRIRPADSIRASRTNRGMASERNPRKHVKFSSSSTPRYPQSSAAALARIRCFVPERGTFITITRDL